MTPELLPIHYIECTHEILLAELVMTHGYVFRTFRYIGCMNIAGSFVQMCLRQNTSVVSTISNEALKHYKPLTTFHKIDVGEICFVNSKGI